jgi:hypothetical protein
MAWTKMRRSEKHFSGKLTSEMGRKRISARPRLGNASLGREVFSESRFPGTTDPGLYVMHASGLGPGTQGSRFVFGYHPTFGGI